MSLVNMFTKMSEGVKANEYFGDLVDMPLAYFFTENVSYHTFGVV